MNPINKFLSNKKADIILEKVVHHILEIIFTISVGVFIFFIVHVEKDIDTFPVESNVLFSRILYSNNGLWFYDAEIDRIYPGILEFENFNDVDKIESLLNKAIYYGDDNKRAAAELILKEENGAESVSVYYNKNMYREWEGLYKAGITKGAGGRQGKTKTFNILIKKQQELIPGNLEITVLIPNR